MDQRIHCADIIATLQSYENRYVIIERLTTPKGLALPGGKREPNEALEATACREFLEETGLRLAISYYVGMYNSPGRDPRGPYVSHVFRGLATGTPRDEPGKTRVLLLTEAELLVRAGEFVVDHATIIADFLRQKQ